MMPHRKRPNADAPEARRSTIRRKTARLEVHENTVTEPAKPRLDAHRKRSTTTKMPTTTPKHPDKPSNAIEITPADGLKSP